MTVFPLPGAIAIPTRGETLFASVSDRIRQELKVVSQTRVDRHALPDAPFILDEQPHVRIRLELRELAKRLLIRRVAPGDEVREARERVAAGRRPRKRDVHAIEQDVGSSFEEMRPALLRQCVGHLEQVDVARGRRRRRRAEVRDAGDAHRRTDRIVHRRIEAAVRELHAQLVDGHARQRRDQVERAGLIAIVQSRPSRHRAESAGVARVRAVHRVRAVSQIESAGPAQVLIRANEHVRRRVAARERSGRNQRPRDTGAPPASR